jgi:hypothetical protein
MGGGDAAGRGESERGEETSTLPLKVRYSSAFFV